MMTAVCETGHWLWAAFGPSSSPAWLLFHSLGHEESCHPLGSGGVYFVTPTCGYKCFLCLIPETSIFRSIASIQGSRLIKKDRSRRDLRFLKFSASGSSSLSKYSHFWLKMFSPSFGPRRPQILGPEPQFRGQG